MENKILDNEELKFNGVVKEKAQDPRDYKITRFVPNEDMNPLKEFCLDLPETINITKDQSVYSACVGFAFSTALSVLAYQKTHKWIDLDPFMIYGTRYEGDWTGKGMIMREAVKVPYKEGDDIVYTPSKYRETEGSKEITLKPASCT